jgi:hypothetical protein
MKPALKYAILSVLYQAGDRGFWEYELYALLRNRYERSSLCSMREELIGFSTLGWTSALAVREVDNALLRKIRLQKRHHPFIEYQLDVSAILRDLRITDEEIAQYQTAEDAEEEYHGQHV